MNTAISPSLSFQSSNEFSLEVFICDKDPLQGQIGFFVSETGARMSAEKFVL